jgi:hypothetical protein
MRDSAVRRLSAALRAGERARRDADAARRRADEIKREAGRLLALPNYPFEPFERERGGEG